MKLFDACILLILTYGSEIWAALERLDFDIWDSCPAEKGHLNFCKHLPGVNRSTTNIMWRAEFGRRPLKLVTDLRVLNYKKHSLSLLIDDLARLAMHMNEVIFAKAGE